MSVFDWLCSKVYMSSFMDNQSGSSFTSDKLNLHEYDQPAHTFFLSCLYIISRNVFHIMGQTNNYIQVLTRTVLLCYGLIRLVLTLVRSCRKQTVVCIGTYYLPLF